MKGIRIVSTGKALPKRIVSNDDLKEIIDTSDEWITTRTGIKTRRYCKEETNTSLAIEAATKAIEKGNIDMNQIGAILVATTTADLAFPTTACRVQKALGMDEEVMSFDLNAGCTGFLLGLNVARGLLQTQRKKYVLLIGSEQLSRIVNFEDRGTCILFGDGAGAAILEASDGAYFQRSWTRGNEDVLSCPGIGNGINKLQMKGSEVFKFAVTVLEQSLRTVMEDAGVTIDDVDYVLCHQANARIIGHVQKKFKGHEDKFMMNIQKYGNTSAASIPILMDEMRDEGKLQPGSKVLLAGFGAGLSWSSAYIEI